MDLLGIISNLPAVAALKGEIEEANRLLQASGLRRLKLGRLYPADVLSTM